MKIPRKIVVLLSLLISSAFSNTVIEGVVINEETGITIPGADVLIVGTDQGRSTDKEGRFRIEWTGDYPVVLRVSHIAYVSQEIEITSTKPVRISLVPKVLKGEEVTVMGERTRTQLEMSTAIDIMEIEAIELQGSRDVGSALRRISSLYVDQSSSGAQTVSIRGSNANEVAVYLDGVKINSANSGVADLSQIDLYSIQRIEILRGGSAYLFGQGNLGGVLNLASSKVSDNGLSVDWGKGLSFDNDLDLSISGSRVLGRVGMGGRFSGRFRVYEGRTMTTSAFSNLFGDLNIRGGSFKGRWYQLTNALTYPSGNVASGDQQTITSVRFLGNILGTSDWEIFSGGRTWAEVNNFFINMNQSLKDINISFRIGKSFRLRFMETTAQIERENQIFTADRTFVKPERNLTIDSDSELFRQTDGLILMTRWFNEPDLEVLRRLELEVTGRLDRVATDRFQKQISTHTDEGGSVYAGPQEVAKERDRSEIRFMSRRIGFRMEGLSERLEYTLFIGSGNNKRLPSLNDLFVKANTRRDSLREASIGPESLNTIEINLELVLSDLESVPIISELEFNTAYFQSNYDNKIGYRELKSSLGDPPVPYNEPKADIRGFEAGIIASFFNNRLQLHANVTKLSVENPVLFPDKPSFRSVIVAEWYYDWLVVSFDYFKESERFARGSGYGRFFEPRENANLNITMQKQIRGVNVSLSYTMRNLMSRGDKNRDSDFDIIFFNYYNQYRGILTLRVGI